MQPDCKLRAAGVQARLTARTRALVLNSPSNPTGVVIDQQELRTIAELAVERGFLLISDETYEHFVYAGGMPASVASVDPEVKARTIVVNTLSKTYGMTGWRVGYAAGPAPIIKGIADLNSNSTSNVTSIAQAAAVAALDGPQDCVGTIIAEFARRRVFVVDGLRALGYTCPTPEGAFYVFPQVPGGDSVAFAERLLTEGHIATVPGAAFCGEGHIRVSYAASMAVLEETLDRLRRFAP
jgi:aspartate aminotransferase